MNERKNQTSNQTSNQRESLITCTCTTVYKRQFRGMFLDTCYVESYVKTFIDGRTRDIYSLAGPIPHLISRREL